MKSYTARDIIRILLDDGWYEVGHEGSHKQFKHPTKSGKVTMPVHSKDVNIQVVKSVERQSGLKF